MGDFGFGDTICIIFIGIVLVAIAMGEGITDIFTSIGSHANVFQYIILLVWAVLSIMFAVISRKKVSYLVFHLLLHTGLTAVFGWAVTKILSGMVYVDSPEGDWLGIAISKCLFLIDDFVYLALFVIATGIYAFFEYVISVEVSVREGISTSNDVP